MSSIKLKGSTSGDVTITVPAEAGTNTVTIPAVTGTLPLSNLDHVTNRPNTKPFIINGNFAVAQRGTSADGTSAYLIDRWKKQAATTGNVAVSQDTDAPTGFINSEKMLASGASSFFQTGQQIEYKNFYPLLGKAASLSFYYKSDVDVIIRIRTGTSTADSVVLFAGSVASTATVSPSADWVQYVHNFTLASNVTSLSIEFATGTLANTDFVYLAGVQLEQGTFDANSIAPFQHESFGDNLARCQRYCTAITKEANYGPVMMAHGVDANTARGAYFFRTPMRSAPSFTATGDFIRSYGSSTAASSATAVSTRFSHSIDWTVSGAFALDEGILITFKTGDASLIYDAEL